MNNKQNRKILITGGTGFIGRILKNQLTTSGFNVLNIGRSKEENISIELTNPNLNKVIKDFAPQFICHLASGSNIARAEENKEKEFKDTVTSTEHLISAIDKIKGINLIYLSSQAVYGYPQELPVKETSNLNPVTEYGKNKLAVEKLIAHSDLNHIIFRVSSVYGIGQDYNKSGAIAKFIHKLKTNQSPIIFNSLNTFSDYIYVEDVVSAVVLFIKSWEKLNIKKEIYNLGSGKPVTLRELLDILYKFFPYAPKPEIKKNPLYPTEDAKGLYLDINKIKIQTAWAPNVNLKDGINYLLTQESKRAESIKMT